jgi:hypothetical protein
MIYLLLLRIIAPIGPFFTNFAFGLSNRAIHARVACGAGDLT